MLSNSMIQLSKEELIEYNGGLVTIGVLLTIVGIGAAVTAVTAAYNAGYKDGYEEKDLEYKLQEN